MKIFLVALCILLTANVQAKTFPKYSVQKFPGRVLVQVDIEPQFETSPLDVLFVVDDSGSMSQHQKNIAIRTPILAKGLVEMHSDFHIGVLSTSVGQYTRGVPPGTLLGSPKVVTPLTPVDSIAKNLLLGTSGSSTESPFDSIQLAFTEPLLSGSNSGFLRPGARLALVLITDAEDQSKIAGTDLINTLRNLKGDLNQVTAFSWIIPATDSVCVNSRDEYGVFPVKIEDFTKQINGRVYSLCDMNDVTIADFTRKLAAFGATAGLPTPPTYIREIPLPAIPSFETIKVQYGNMKLVAGDMNHGWIYDSAKNQIFLGDEINFAQEPMGTKLEISFVPEDWTK
jgi:hypothetical protein